MSRHPGLSPIEEIIADAKAGRMVVLVDDEDRENEGDLVIPAGHADAEAINFMAKHGRGLICLALTSERVHELGLPPMARLNQTRHSTAFTVSIEAREGVTTGISAADRARTIAVAIDPERGQADLVSPGHVFPLEARDGGVLVRAGHTEASVDIARLAGLNPAAVICEIMNDDGSMARLPDLMAFAQLHGLKVGTIADLIAYRRRKDCLVERVSEAAIDSHFGGAFRLLLYRTTFMPAAHLALVKGEIGGDEPVLVRMHTANPLEDILGDRTGHEGQLHQAMRMIGEQGRGVVVLLKDPHTDSLINQVRRKRGEAPDKAGDDTVLRDYGVGAQILADLGVRRMILLSNTRRSVIALDGFDLEIVDHRPIPPLPREAQT